MTPDKIVLTDLHNLKAFAGGQRVTIAQAYPDPKVEFPTLYARYKAIGWTESRIGQMTPLVAAWEETVWKNSPFPYLSNGKPFMCGARVNIELGAGIWAVNYPRTGHFGQSRGNGPGYVYPDAGGPNGYGGTTLEVWEAGWIDEPGFEVSVADLGPQANKIRATWRSTTWNGEGTVGAYHELAGESNVHIRGTGAGQFAPGVLYAGYACWDMGSMSRFGMNYFSGIDVGFLAVRSTPMTVHGTCGMNGNVAHILSIGGAGGTINVYDWECDDFPQFLLARPGFGRDAGGKIHLQGGKIETGVTPESRGPWKGTIIADVQGQFCLTGDVSYASAMVKVDSLIVVDPKLTNGAPQECMVDFVVKRFAAPSKSIHRIGSGTFSASVGEYGSERIVWTSASVSNNAGASRRLGFQRWNGTAWAPAFSHTNGTPAYDYGNGTVPPVEPPPVDPNPDPGQTDPPPTGDEVLWSASNVSNTQAGLSVAVNLSKPVTRVRFTNLKITGTLNWQGIVWGATIPEGVRVRPDGTWTAPGGSATVSTGKTNRNTVYPEVVLTLPQPLTARSVYAYPGTGSALQFTADKIELLA